MLSAECWVLGRRGIAALLFVLAAYPPTRLPAQSTLTVFNAGSLGRPLREALNEFGAGRARFRAAQENAGSLESARKLTELDKIPDVLALADEAIFPALLAPRYTTWYVAFARNEMVLAYTDGSAFAAEISPANWSEVVRRPGVRTGRSDPMLDPNGYRTLMVLELEERRTGTSGLAAQLLAAMPERYLRPKEADLVALLQTGELDYAWSYRSIAQGAGLKYVDLPPEVDLGDPARADLYATVSIRVGRGTSRTSTSGIPDSATIRGAPILYALAIPKRAENPLGAQQFVTWFLGPAGRAVLARNGFTVLERPLVRGTAPRWLTLLAE